MPKFFTDKNLISDKSLTIKGEDVAHISRVLRMKPGEEITVCDGEGNDYSAKIAEITKEEVVADIISVNKCEAEPSVKITLYQALPKQGKMEYIIQKNTELGVCEFVPVYTKRCVVKPTDKTARWQKVAFEAAKQCGRGIIPKVRDTINIKEAAEEISKFSHKAVFYECEKETTLKDVLKQGIKEIAILIGPEGGFEQNEIEMLKGMGVPSVTLGKRILRTETAAAAVTPIILFVQGDV